MQLPSLRPDAVHPALHSAMGRAPAEFSVLRAGLDTVDLLSAVMTVAASPLGLGSGDGLIPAMSSPETPRGKPE
ncbi:hypothetical protein [Lentzea sp. NPDC004782]|uniref:hypothetical protein n=1 Tax=Lentzea sp. NPDC004782 TaxID=3154458 RepID=UPI0033B3E2AD